VFQVAVGISSLAAQGGSAEGCGIPASATAVAATVVAVDETGPGFLRTWPTGASAPLASFLNYANTNLVSTGGTITVNGSINVSANVSATDVVIDVQGYYVSPMYAVVNVAGTLHASSARVTGSHLIAGQDYEVDFDRNVSNCAYSVTSETGTGAIAEPRSGNADGVWVEASGTLSSSWPAFTLVVTC
jgi:hypothetical protein